MSAAPGFDLRPLFDKANARAELILSVVRLVIGAALFTFLLATLPNPLRIFLGGPDEVLWRGNLIGQDVLALMTIGSYAVLGGVGLVLHLVGAYQSWMSWPIATTDAAIALTSLWLGLLNTGMTGALAPLVPASWLIVIVLALGTLRYNVALQLWLTVMISISLVVIVWNTDGFLGPEWLTDSKLPGSAFMITPPTLMRIFMLATAGFVMTIAVLRARQLVQQAVADAARRENLVRYLPGELSDLLAEGDIETLRRGRRGPVAVLFIDLRGFTRISKNLDPPEISRLLGRFRARVSAEALPRGGIVDKFVGDGAMIVFGLERESGSDAANAIACARALTSVTLNWSRERADTGENSLNVAMGLHWGEAFIGAVGDEKRLEFTVLGDVVNVASRLEAFAKQQDEPLIVSVAALDRARESRSGWRNLGMVTVRNREESIELFALA